MNLLIEQRPTTLTSSKSQPSPSSQQQHQQFQLSNENDMYNSSSSSSLVLKIKRHSTKQQQQQQANDLHSNSSHMSEEDNQNNNSPASRLKRTSISNTIATRRPSSPAFNGKQQQNTAKRSITIDNNNNDLTSNIDEISSTKRFKREDLNQSSSKKVDACVETVSIGLATEPDQLGPCEPGTSVVLEGIVWNETDSGVLVVNVTWRGKTYVGTLLDSTKQDWACPRLTCESPISDYDARGSSKTSRSKRTSAGGNTRLSTQQNISLCQQVTSNNHLAGLDERRLRNNIKSRQSKRLNNLSSNTNDETPTNSPPSQTINQTFFPSDTSTSGEPQLISCSEPQCHKRFSSTTALGYHLSNAHKQTESNSMSTTVPQASTRDEEDVAHILANVADYVRRSSPPSSIRSSPEHQNSPPTTTTTTTTTTTIKPLENSSTLTWPCPQISSKLVLPASLNQVLSPDSTNRCKLNNNENNLSEQDDFKNSIKSADHFLLHIQDEPIVNKPSTISSPTYQDLNNSKQTPPPITASSPAYSDISDEEPTTTTTITESIPSSSSILPPSTINLLTATNGKIDENGNNRHSSSISTNSDLTNPAWTAQMLLQQFGPFIQQQQTLVTDISSTPNRLNSNNTCPSSNGTSDSTVKNILDARRSSTTKSSSSSSSPSTSLYPFHSNESKFPTPIINTLTSPNENLLHLSTSTIKPMDVIDYSLNNTRSSNAGQYHHSSSLHPSR